MGGKATSLAKLWSGAYGIALAFERWFESIACFLWIMVWRKRKRSLEPFFKFLPKRVFQRNIGFPNVKLPVMRSLEEPTTVRMQTKNGPFPGNGGAAAGSF